MNNSNQITPAPDKNPNLPAERLAIHAVKNGWTLDVDFHARSGSCGQALPQYVYTRPEEVAGAVLGLITKGTPQSGVHPWREIDHQANLIARHEETHRKLQTEIDRLTEELKKPAGPRGNPPAEVHVGDVWRSSDGHIRAVSEVSPNGQRIRYLHTFPKSSPRMTQADSAISLAEFLRNVRPSAHRTPNAFSPACHPNEPEEGFMVGDVWTYNDKEDVATRRVVKVSKKRIEYDYRTHANDDDVCIIRMTRHPSIDSINQGGATLTRK